MERYRGQTAVITGAGSGLGRALALKAASLGMSTVLADISAAALEETSGMLLASDSPPHERVSVDVSRPEEVERLAEVAYRRFGQVDLLFNNAGILRGGGSWECSHEEWQLVLGTNLWGVINCVKAFVPRMIAAARPSCVANIASIGGINPAPFFSAYCTSKFAVVGLSRCLEAELKAVGAPISVACVCPGAIATSIFSASRPPSAPAAAEVSASQRMRRALLERVTAEGISPSKAADLIFKGIADGEFWIVTHVHQPADASGPPDGEVRRKAPDRRQSF